MQLAVFDQPVVVDVGGAAEPGDYLVAEHTRSRARPFVCFTVGAFSDEHTDLGMLGAPLSTILMVFELTGDYQLTIGVMIATVIASLITRQAFGFSFFTWQLNRRGLNLRKGREQGLLHAVHVSDVMRGDHMTVPAVAPMPEIRKALQQCHYGELFVIDEDGRLHGTVMLSDLAEAAFDTALDAILNAEDVCRTHPPLLAETDDLEAAMALMDSTQESIVAVVADRDGQCLTGYVRQRDVIRAYDRALMQARDEAHGEG